MLYKWMIAPAVLLGGLLVVVGRNTRDKGHDESADADEKSDKGAT